MRATATAAAEWDMGILSYLLIVYLIITGQFCSVFRLCVSHFPAEVSRCPLYRGPPAICSSSKTFDINERYVVYGNPTRVKAGF